MRKDELRKLSEARRWVLLKVQRRSKWNTSAAIVVPGSYEEHSRGGTSAKQGSVEVTYLAVDLQAEADEVAPILGATFRVYARDVVEHLDKYDHPDQWAREAWQSHQDWKASTVAQRLDNEVRKDRTHAAARAFEALGYEAVGRLIYHAGLGWDEVVEVERLLKAANSDRHGRQAPLPSV